MSKSLISARQVIGGLAAILLLTLPGCSEDELGDVTPATGTVYLDGEPASNVSISLVPQAGVKGRGGYAKSSEDGSFEFMSTPESPGVLPGKYQVLFSRYTMPDGSPIPPDAMPEEGEIVNQLHPLYSDPGTSPVFADVPGSGGEPLKFELSSKPRR